jgi:hypothetical protein
MLTLSEVQVGQEKIFPSKSGKNKRLWYNVAIMKLTPRRTLPHFTRYANGE